MYNRTICQQSEDYRDAVYAANWYGDKHFMDSVIITLSQKPLTLTACNFAFVTVDIFVKVFFFIIIIKNNFNRKKKPIVNYEDLIFRNEF